MKNTLITAVIVTIFSICLFVIPNSNSLAGPDNSEGSQMDSTISAHMENTTLPLQIEKDRELDLYKGTVTLLSVLVSIITIVFGGLLAINVFSGNKIIREAKLELSQIIDSRKEQENSFNKLKQQSEEILKSTIEEIHNEAKNTLDKIVKHEYEFSTIKKYKKILLEELEKNSPDPKAVYFRLTDVIQYPDQTAFEIYKLCVEKLSDNPDIMKAIARAQEVAAQKYSE